MFGLFSKAIINLGAIKQNYINMAKYIGGSSICSAVLKNDAYGLGAKKIAQALYEAGCRDFWVAYITEAIELRNCLPDDSNIYFLQGFNPLCIPQIKNYNVIPVINSIEELSEFRGNDISIVLHIDTGLTRLGIRSADIDTICEDFPNINIKYVISHLACSDEPEDLNNFEQKCKFDKILAKIRTKYPNVKAGLSSSFGPFISPEYIYDIVRVGAYLYGVKTQCQTPENVLSVCSVVLQRYKVPRNTKIGYGATYTTDSETTVAVVSIGYADGIKRSLSGVGRIMFYDNNNIYSARILGAISMDLLVCDVTDMPEGITRPHSTAFILDNNYTINEMAKDAGTIPYEILTDMAFNLNRVEKLYV